MRALQIGMTASARGGGGLDRYYFGLLRALAARGDEPRGLVVGDAAEVAAQGVSGIECFAREGVTMLARWRALRSAVDRRLPGCDLVVSHFAPYALPVLDRIRSRPCVVHFHGSWARESEAEGAGRLSCAAKATLERLVYRGGARFIVLTRAVADALQRDFKIPDDVIRVVPGGVDLTTFTVGETHAQARSALGLPLDRPVLVTARRLVRAKGIEPLIDAIAIVRETIPDVLLVVAGTGPLADTLRENVRARSLEHNVRFAGFVSDLDLQRLYRGADLSVVPSVAMEGFGLVVIEALACGTPVMVTPVAGLPETVRDLNPELIFRSVAPRDIAAGIAAALGGALALPSADACRAYAERFDWPNVAERVRAVYEEVA